MRSEPFSGVPSMNEEQTEEEARAEFEAFKKQTENDFYRIAGKGISAWAKTEGQLVFIAAMLLDTSLEKAGLVFYSIPNFHSWLSITRQQRRWTWESRATARNTRPAFKYRTRHQSAQN